MPIQTSEIYDGIILGSGHNSLVLQAYLGKAGLKVLCLESRDVAGGGLATVEDPRHPGFLHNTHSFYHRALTQMPWYRDLELERHGAVYLEPELNVALVLKSGEVLEWWRSFEKTEESFSRFSGKDAATLRRWRERFLPIVEKILIPESQSPPVPSDRRRALLEGSAEGRLLLEVSALSPLEFVLKEFEHPVTQAGLLFFNGLREVDLRCKGFGHHIPSLLASTGKAQMCRGGSAALARALVAAVRESGGNVKVQVKPRKILVENDRVVGVETQAGDVFRARHFVASGLNPQQTFLELIRRAVGSCGVEEKGAQLSLQSRGSALRLESELERASGISGRGSESSTQTSLHGNPGAGAVRAIPRNCAPPRGRDNSSNRHVGQLPNPVRPVSSSRRKAHCVYVGEVALCPAWRFRWLGS